MITLWALYPRSTFTRSFRMTCGCDDTNYRPYVVADESPVTGPSSRFDTLLNIHPECSTRHLTMQSDDCVVMWRVTTVVDKVRVPLYHVKTGPLTPAFVSIPPNGATVEYFVLSIESKHYDPINGIDGGPMPRVVAFCAEMESTRETELYNPDDSEDGDVTVTSNIVQIGTVETPLITIDETTQFRIDAFHVANTSSDPVQVTVYAVPSGGIAGPDNVLIPNFTVTGNNFFEFGEGITVPPGTTLSALASAPGANAIVSGKTSKV